ncbi:MAG: NAD(P)/FAD-dependent oxidoreductase [Lachnospiraceae bacterium]|nr:NAD(P)/FAD-dependent oxidoreductase [Lachnospiraceae bacterium]
MNKVIIIGAGAAGLLAAALASGYENEVIVIEKNEKPGKKLYITGKGRCNLTNACDRDEMMANIISNNRFMYSSFNSFNNYDVMDLFENLGVPLKVERGMRVFPESDKSSDIITALEKECLRKNVKFMYRTKVAGLCYEAVENSKDDKKPSKRVTGVRLEDGRELPADSVIVATGGLSYPSTGSTGDGYNFARSAGHNVTKCYPSLVSLKIKEGFCADMAGLSLKNVRVAVQKNGKELYSGFGEMLFTHTGVSGPLILSCSATAGISCDGAELSIDLKPALDSEKLDERLVRDLSADSHKQLKSVLRGLLPASMVPVFVKKTGLDETVMAGNVTRENRQKIVSVMKNFTMNICGLGGYNEAVVTKGGIDVKQINPATMESKLCSNLYFAGEVLDIDAFTGGFNLQIAWSTAAAAARAVLK